MQTYFELRPKSDSSTRMASCSTLIDIDSVELQSGRIQPQGLVFKVKKGFEKFDFLATGFPGILLCSQKVVDFLESIDAKGWSATKAELSIGKEVLNSIYYIFHVHGTAGPFDYKQSEVIEQLDHSFIELKGRFFDERSANGFDIFVIQNTFMAFVTEHMYTLMNEAKLTNIRFIRNDEYTGIIPLSLYRKSIEEN